MVAELVRGPGPTVTSSHYIRESEPANISDCLKEKTHSLKGPGGQFKHCHQLVDTYPTAAATMKNSCKLERNSLTPNKRLHPSTALSEGRSQSPPALRSPPSALLPSTECSSPFQPRRRHWAWLTAFWFMKSHRKQYKNSNFFPTKKRTNPSEHHHTA